MPFVIKILILAIVQGFCELLPVSSSAHVIIAEKLMGLDPTTPQMTLLFVMLHVFGLGAIALVGMCVVVMLLAYEHMIISPRDLSRMNAAFFTMNGVISVLFFGFVAADVLSRR